MDRNRGEHEPNSDSLDAVIARIVDPEVRACLVDLAHAIEASEGNQLALQRTQEKRRREDPFS